MGAPRLERLRGVALDAASRSGGSASGAAPAGHVQRCCGRGFGEQTGVAALVGASGHTLNGGPSASGRSRTLLKNFGFVVGGAGLSSTAFLAGGCRLFGGGRAGRGCRGAVGATPPWAGAS